MGFLRWLGARRAILPITARLLCARLVKESALFFARELLRPSGAFLYTLRESGSRVAIRHGGVDTATLAEVFYHRQYDPPSDLAHVLGDPGEIVDLGANIGLFGAFATARWPNARLVAYEPDPANAALHQRIVEANALASRWTLVCAAAGVREGQVRFAAGLAVESHVLEGGEGEKAGSDAPTEEITVPVRDVVPELAAADLVKMDIEGGEWEILHDPRFTQGPPRALVLEYHPRSCPGADPRAVAELALTRAGLSTSPISHAGDGHGMLWAWRTE
jgi:FkbM family methyltransferase